MEAAGTPVQRVGSSTIDIHGLMDCQNMSERDMLETVFFHLRSLHFGGRGRTPLEDVAAILPALERAPEGARKKVDQIAGEFAKIANLVGQRVKFVGNEAVPFDDLEEVDPTIADDDWTDTDLPQECFDPKFKKH
ncbi:MAG: hypothetical protein AAB449_02575 [Patescibacteria group bacterium]